tara:strand:+ start:2648 stop:2983 length:336 start_codon:yes stop_codon:yes gene_type:complete
MNDKIEKYIDFVVSDMILSTELKYRNRRRRKFHIFPPYLNENTFISFHSGVVFKELAISDRMWFEKTFSEYMETNYGIPMEGNISVGVWKEYQKRVTKMMDDYGNKVREIY